MCFLAFDGHCYMYRAGQAFHKRPVFSSPVTGFSMTSASPSRSRRGRVVSARLYSVQTGLAQTMSKCPGNVCSPSSGCRRGLLAQISTHVQGDDLPARRLEGLRQPLRQQGSPSSPAPGCAAARPGLGHHAVLKAEKPRCGWAVGAVAQQPPRAKSHTMPPSQAKA